MRPFAQPLRLGATEAISIHQKSRRWVGYFLQPLTKILIATRQTLRPHKLNPSHWFPDWVSDWSQRHRPNHFSPSRFATHCPWGLRCGPTRLKFSSTDHRSSTCLVEIELTMPLSRG